jgi:hypothetical protein
LGAFGYAPVHARVFDVTRGAEFVAFLFDLDGEFAGGGEDEDDGSVAGL